MITTVNIRINIRFINHNTKQCERNRWSLKTVAIDVNFTGNTTTSIKQEMFLSQDNNKIRLI